MSELARQLREALPKRYGDMSDNEVLAEAARRTDTTVRRLRIDVGEMPEPTMGEQAAKFAESVGGGVLAGLGDEAAGAIGGLSDAALARARGEYSKSLGELFTEGYEETRDIARTRQDELFEDAPAAPIVGNLMGAVAGTLSGAGAAQMMGAPRVANALTPMTLRGQMRLGGLEGAAHGFGHGEGTENRLTNAAAGLGLGALAPPAIHGTIRGVRAAGPAVANAAGNIAGNFAGGMGPGVRRMLNIIRGGGRPPPGGAPPPTTPSTPTPPPPAGPSGPPPAGTRINVGLGGLNPIVPGQRLPLGRRPSRMQPRPFARNPLPYQPRASVAPQVHAAVNAPPTPQVRPRPNIHLRAEDILVPDATKTPWGQQVADVIIDDTLTPADVSAFTRRVKAEGGLEEAATALGMPNPELVGPGALTRRINVARRHRESLIAAEPTAEQIGAALVDASAGRFPYMEGHFISAIERMTPQQRRILPLTIKKMPEGSTPDFVLNRVASSIVNKKPLKFDSVRWGRAAGRPVAPDTGEPLMPATPVVPESAPPRGVSFGADDPPLPDLPAGMGIAGDDFWGPGSSGGVGGGGAADIRAGADVPSGMGPRTFFEPPAAPAMAPRATALPRMPAPPQATLKAMQPLPRFPGDNDFSMYGGPPPAALGPGRWEFGPTGLPTYPTAKSGQQLLDDVVPPGTLYDYPPKRSLSAGTVREITSEWSERLNDAYAMGADRKTLDKLLKAAEDAGADMTQLRKIRALPKQPEPRRKVTVENAAATLHALGRSDLPREIREELVNAVRAQTRQAGVNQTDMHRRWGDLIVDEANAEFVAEQAAKTAAKKKAAKKRAGPPKLATVPKDYTPVSDTEMLNSVAEAIVMVRRGTDANKSEVAQRLFNQAVQGGVDPNQLKRLVAKKMGRKLIE